MKLDIPSVWRTVRSLQWFCPPLKMSFISSNILWKENPRGLFNQVSWVSREHETTWKTERSCNWFLRHNPEDQLHWMLAGLRTTPFWILGLCKLLHCRGTEGGQKCLFLPSKSSAHLYFQLFHQPSLPFWRPCFQEMKTEAAVSFEPGHWWLSINSPFFQCQIS